MHLVLCDFEAWYYIIPEFSSVMCMWTCAMATCWLFCINSQSQLDIENNSGQKLWQIVEFVFGKEI